MTSKNAYRKPVVASSRVFSLTSSDCDVSLTIPGPCADFMMFTGCQFFRKSPDDEICTGYIIKPIFKS